MNGRCLAAAIAVILLALGLPFWHWGSQAFVGHMMAHMLLVVVAAPLLTLGLGPALNSLRPSPLLGAAVEFVVVWGWHLPVLHGAARESLPVFALEQGLFLGAGLLVWLGALRASEPLAGAFALFLTGMHMTALAVLLILAEASLYGGDVAAQRLGGMLMLGIASPICLIAGLWLAARGLTDRPAATEAGEGSR